MREAAVLEQPSVSPAGFDLAQYWARSAEEFREKLPRYYATLLAANEVMRWVRYRGWRLEQETAEQNAVRVRMRFDAEAEALQFALSFGGDIEVLEPDELRAKVLAGARAVMERYRPAAQT
jgi:predicted DNA-binding transcriptional regulator YafY